MKKEKLDGLATDISKVLSDLVFGMDVVKYGFGNLHGKYIFRSNQTVEARAYESLRRAWEYVHDLDCLVLARQKHEKKSKVL
jgi:hypothetical protein